MSVLEPVVSEKDIQNFLKENEPLLTCSTNNSFFSKPKINITKEEIAKSMRIAAGNKEQAARILGIHRSTLWRWLKKHQIDVEL